MFLKLLVFFENIERNRCIPLILFETYTALSNGKIVVIFQLLNLISPPPNLKRIIS